jgi:hypothetical protein
MVRRMRRQDPFLVARNAAASARNVGPALAAGFLWRRAG